MSFFHINPSDPSRRIEPIGERPEDKDSKRHFIKHKGRTWEEKEQSEAPQIGTIPSFNQVRKNRENLWEKSQFAKEAKALFETLTTLEEKVAQLVFLTSEAFYDATAQRELELLIQTWQVGGVIFTEGEFKRQAYLIEKCSEVTKTPLLFANDFFHGLSFYFGEDARGLLYPEDVAKRFSDLGKAVVGINKRLGIDIQFACQRGAHPVRFTEAQYHAFSQGVKSAGGICGKENKNEVQHQFSAAQHLTSFKQQTFDPKISLSSIMSQPSMQEFIGVRSLNFLDLTDRDINIEQLIAFFKTSYDAIILNDKVDEIVLQICRFVKTGRISEKELDQRVLKLLYFKVQKGKI